MNAEKSEHKQKQTKNKQKTKTTESFDGINIFYKVFKRQTTERLGPSQGHQNDFNYNAKRQKPML